MPALLSMTAKSSKVWPSPSRLEVGQPRVRILSPGGRDRGGAGTGDTTMRGLAEHSTSRPTCSHQQARCQGGWPWSPYRCSPRRRVLEQLAWPRPRAHASWVCHREERNAASVDESRKPRQHHTPSHTPSLPRPTPPCVCVCVCVCVCLCVPVMPWLQQLRRLFTLVDGWCWPRRLTLWRRADPAAALGCKRGVARLVKRVSESGEAGVSGKRRLRRSTTTAKWRFWSVARSETSPRLDAPT
jgi:hypothetical protein